MEIQGTPYSYEGYQSGEISDIAKRVQELREIGSLSPEALGHLRKFFRIKNIYHSNAIEGNVLSIGETKQVVAMGLTITGKPLKDQAEAKNLSHALDFLEQLAGNATIPITEADIRQLHLLVLKDINDNNAGKYREVQVEISGSSFKPPSPESISPAMKEFGEWIKESSISSGNFGSIEGLLNAAVAHTWLVYIHPFIDGNGRVARLLMNLILMRYGYPIAIITKEDRLRYYDALEQSQSTDLSGFLSLLVECVHESLEEYEKAAKEQKEKEEWTSSIAAKFSAKERIRAINEYEVWKNAMELFKSYFRQTAESIDERAPACNVYFKDFGMLEFEKYWSLRSGGSAKRTWFFRLDFLSGDKSTRYLFFFGSPGYIWKNTDDVSLFLAREEPPNSFHYERLDAINSPNVPRLVEIRYKTKEEIFSSRTKTGHEQNDKVDNIGRLFFEDVISKHFSA